MRLPSAATASPLLMANQECIFLSRPGPDGAKESDFSIQSCETPSCGPGEVVVQMQLFSCDPAMRTYMAGDANNLSKQEGILYYKYAAAWQPGRPPSGSCVGEVIASRDPSIPVGALVEGQMQWRKVSSVKGRGLRLLDRSIPAEQHISVLGGTGMAAYLPIAHIGQPKAGEVAFVSAAAGATGSTAAQVLRNLGCDVIGSAGSDDKVELLRSMGIKAFNYKRESTLDALRRLCPKGLDIFFDNVGGETLEAAIEVMNDFGRIIVCGAISQYDLPPERRYGVRNLFHVTAKRITMRGFVTDPVSFTPEQFDEARATLSNWLKESKIACESTIVDGFERLPNALLGLLRGENTGKMLVRAETDSVTIPTPVPPACEFIFSIDLELTAPITTLSDHTNGKALCGITGGSFSGPKLKGDVIGIGGDWAKLNDNGTTHVDVRATLKTHDGAYILMSYGGRGDATGQDQRIVAQPLFETADARYMWLNSVVGIGVGRGVTWATGGKANYDVFRVILPKL